MDMSVLVIPLTFVIAILAFIVGVTNSALSNIKKRVEQIEKKLGIVEESK